MRSLMPSSLLLLATSILYATQVSLALHIDLPRRSEASLPNLLSRAPNATSGLDISSGGSYFINITLGGKEFAVMIDTGSSDLWVAGTVPNANDTGVQAQVQYAVGSAGGPVKTADMTILGYTVPNQAFLEMTASSDNPDGTGLIGLGPRYGSQVLAALNNSSPGDPPIDRIFSEDTTIPNYITVLLSRPNDTREAYTGEMTISEILPEFQNITSQPNISVSVLQSRISTDQHFSVLLDADGIIGPDGKAIPTTSNASAAPPHGQNQLQVLFDTGFSLPQLPESVVNAIYSGVKGAQLINVPALNGDVWEVDCEAEINVTFKIGGQSYPIHPLDVSREVIDAQGESACYGTFQTIIAGAQDPTFDAILGMTFLSNVYLLLDYGDFTDGSQDNRSAPYVQILSTTNPAAAHADFVATRLGGSDTTGSQHFSSSGSSGKSFYQRFRIPILAVAAVGAVAVLTGAVLLVAKRRKPSYRPLYDPAPAGAMPMQHVAGYSAGGAPYADPWK